MRAAALALIAVVLVSPARLQSQGSTRTASAPVIENLRPSWNSTEVGLFVPRAPIDALQQSVARLKLSHSASSRRRTGAIVGLLVGGVATYAILYSGGSTAPCNRSANQDAMGSGECLGITAAGALAGAGLGAIIGGLIAKPSGTNAIAFTLKY